MPQITYFNYGDANDMITQILDTYHITDFKLVDKKLNLYKSLDAPHSEIWFIIFNKAKSDIDFITKFKQDAIKLKKVVPVLIPYVTYKKNDDLDRIVAQVYKIASNQLKRPILSDKKQTEDMADIWINFYEHKSKYKITFSAFIDTNTNSVMSSDDLENTDNGIFNKFEEGQRYRILIDFNNTLIEQMEDKINNRIYFK